MWGLIVVHSKQLFRFYLTSVYATFLPAYCASRNCHVMLCEGNELVPRPPTKKGGLVHTARVLVRMRIFPLILGNPVISVKYLLPYSYRMRRLSLWPLPQPASSRKLASSPGLRRKREAWYTLHGCLCA